MGRRWRGLIADHEISHEQFLGFVHDIDRSSLAPHPALVEAISALPGRKLILTNGSTHHAARTTEQLGFADTFEAVFDIVDANLVPKPDPATYDRFFDRHGVDPKRAAMFEDIARNLIVPHERGMMTVLVVPAATGTDHREPWEAAEAAEAVCRFRHRRHRHLRGGAGARRRTAREIIQRFSQASAQLSSALGSDRERRLTRRSMLNCLAGCAYLLILFQVVM